MTLITEHAKRAAEALHVQGYAAGYTRSFWVIDGAVSYYRHCPLLMRDKSGDGYLIRWPENFYKTSPDPTERGILNALLRGVGLSDGYRFMIHGSNTRKRWTSRNHKITPLFWINQLGRWHRVVDFQYNTWYPLVYGDLARLAAMHAHEHETSELEEFRNEV